MGSDNQVNSIQQIEMIDDLMSKNPSRPSCISFPSLNVLRVRPHQVGHRTFMRYLLLSVNQPHLINCRQVWREPTMNAKNTAIDNGAQRKVIKGLVKIFPAVGVAILFVDLIEESVHHGDVSTFVVASEEVDSVGVFDFEAEEEGDGFYGVVASVYEVSDHDELVVGDSSSFSEHLLDVVELSVDITCDFDGAID